MKITCPECGTVYKVAPNTMGPDGRDVRCTRCDTRWHASCDQNHAETQNGLERDNDMFAPIANDADITAEGGTANDVVQTDDREDFADWSVNEEAQPDRAPASTTNSAAVELADAKRPADIETLAKRPKIVVRQRRSAGSLRRMMRVAAKLRRVNPRRVFGAVVFLTAIGCGLLAVTLRDPIVARMPDLAGLYELAGFNVNLRGLTIEDLRTFREREEGSIVLVVEGNIRNPTREAVVVPAIRFALRSEDAQEIYAWIVEPRVRRLEAGKASRFRTRLASPPDLAADIHVRFTERRSQHARLE